MSKYTPDRWSVVEINNNGDIIPKVFAGWYGSFTQGDSWKLSSGIIEAKEYEDRYEFLNHSGSVYVCYKERYGMSGYMSNMYHSFEEQLKAIEHTNVTLRIMEDVYGAV